MYVFPQGGADASIDIPMRDSSDDLITGLAFDDAGASCYYRRPGAAPVQINLATLASETAAHSDGGFVEIDATNQPGMYRLDLPDAAIDRGENFVTVHISFTASASTIILVLLDPYPSVVQGVVDDVSATATTFETDLSGVPGDQFNDCWLMFPEGTNAGASREITDFDGATGAFTTEPFPSAPADTDPFLVINR